MKNKMVIEPEFKIGQRVWHALGGEDSAGICTGIVVRANELLYRVVWADKEEQTHYSVELSQEKVTDFGS